jgi:hypothetical protein
MERWSEGVLNASFISTDESIMTVVRQQPKMLVLQMVNFTDLDSDQQWDVVHTPPTPRQNIPVKMQMVQKPTQVFWDGPEQIEGPQSISFEYSNGVLTFHVPQIIFTGLVAIYE